MTTDRIAQAQPSNPDMAFNVMLHDYISSDPNIPNDAVETGYRGGDVSLLSEAQTEAMVREGLAFVALIQGIKEGRPLRLGENSHSVHQVQGYERGIDSFRDGLVHIIGMGAGIDVDGGLISTERQVQMPIHPNDQKRLGIDNLPEEHLVETTVSSFPFSYFPNKTSWRVNEIVIPGFAIPREEPVPVGTLMRILSVTPYRQPKVSNDAV